MSDQQEQQVQELNTYVKTKIAPSKIHGVGVFALRDIPKGQKLYADMMTKVYTLRYSSFGKLFPEVKEMLLERFPLIVNGSNFLYPDTRIVAFMNHSEKPNYNAKSDLVLVDIKEGDEITENYKNIEGWKIVFGWLKE